MIYEPEEDSYLMLNCIRQIAQPNLSVLEIGTGSGILAFEALSWAKSVLACDINPEAVKFCKNKLKERIKLKDVSDSDAKKIKFIQSDLFSKIPKKKFDLIIFNPPYLPYEPNEPDDCALATCGGKKGYEIIERFINKASYYLNQDGIILLLFSSLSKKEKIDEFIKEGLFEFELVGEKKISFESLFVYKIVKSDVLNKLEQMNITNIKRLTKGHRGFIFTGCLNPNKPNKTKLAEFKSNQTNTNKTKVAIKIQRNDIDAMGTVNNEIIRLKKLNEYNIGPKLLLSGDDFFVYAFVEGIFPVEFFKSASKLDILKVLKNVFEQMFMLDQLKLNKEEMHHPLKHIIISKNATKITLLDFERCKPTDRPHNVTQFCQFVTSGLVQRILHDKKIEINKDEIISSAKEYNKTLSRTSFDKILNLIV